MDITRTEQVAVEMLVERGWRFIDFVAPGSFTLDPDLPTLLEKLLEQVPKDSYCWQQLTLIERGINNPFWTTEAMGEHIGAAWSALAKSGHDTSRRNQLHNRFPVGTPEYHLQAIEHYHAKLFQMLACLLPQLFHLDASSTWEALRLRREELAKELAQAEL